MAGRPTKYTKAIGDEICRRLADGESLRAICADEAQPAQSQIYVWLQKHSEFQEQYARAREAQAALLADELLEIADDGTNDYVERTRSDGSSETVLDAEHVQRSRLRVDTRKWLLSKMLPKVYGDKLQHSGTDGGPLVVQLVKYRA